MDGQIDTAQQRAEDHRRRLKKAIGDMLETDECLDIFDRAVADARRDALAEAVREIESYFEKMASRRPHALTDKINLAERLDRLREGR